jgi:hypothetical protein
LAHELPRGAVVSVDGQVLGLAAAQALQRALSGAGIELRTEEDVLDAVWPDRLRCQASRSMNTRRRTQHCHVPPSWPRCAKRWHAMARRTTSFPR